MEQISDSSQADVVRAFNATSRCLDDLLNIDNPSFEQLVDQYIPLNFSLKRLVPTSYLSSLFGLTLVHNRCHRCPVSLWRFSISSLFCSLFFLRS